MSWAEFAIADLSFGRSTYVKPRGNSMTPRIESGTVVRLVPYVKTQPKKGDVVLVKVSGRVLLHLITGVRDDQFQISNNHGHVNGWVSRAAIYGKAVL